MAYKLLRLMRYFELPGESWRGWYFTQGHLVTPEGRTISGKDGAWWSLLVRQAQGFGELYKRFNSLPVQHPAAAGGPVAQRGRSTATGAAPLGGEVPVTPHFSPVERKNDQSAHVNPTVGMPLVGLACDGTPHGVPTVEVPVTPQSSLTGATNQPSFLDFTPVQVSYRTPVFSPKNLRQEPRS